MTKGHWFPKVRAALLTVLVSGCAGGGCSSCAGGALGPIPGGGDRSFAPTSSLPRG